MTFERFNHGIGPGLTWQRVVDGVRDFVLVRGELRPGRSLTNDAEDLIAYLDRAAGQGGLGAARVLYEDSEGTWDELLHDGARFTGFGHIGACDAGDALVRARATTERGGTPCDRDP